MVGSSAISSLGRPASAIAIITRWRMPPESSCGYWREPPGRLGDAHPVEQLDARARGRLGGAVVGADRLDELARRRA